MITNLVPIYSCAALTITTLGIFAKQNRKSGWKRRRANNMADALREFYSDLGVVTDPSVVTNCKPMTAEEVIGFSAQLLQLRGALASSAAVYRNEVVESELVHQ